MCLIATCSDKEIQLHYERADVFGADTAGEARDLLKEKTCGIHTDNPLGGSHPNQLYLDDWL